MSTNTKHSYKLSVKRATRRTRRRRTTATTTTPSIGYCSINCRGGGNIKTTVQIERKYNCKPKLSQKLEALKNLIPANNGDEDNMVKPDELFKETADYIVLLRTRVLVLQKLIEFYGNNAENESDVLL